MARAIVIAAAGVCAASLVLGACRSGGARGDVSHSPAGAVALPTMADGDARDLPGLHNVVAFHDGYFSGSVPEGEEGFATLAAMGVRTVISVDGATPDVEAARAQGLRYIHLPIGYDGFGESRRLELARASRDALAEGPVYVHCHHGKHRSAGAAGAAAVSLGWATPEEAVARMHVSGTSPNYRGLFACVSGAAVLAPGDIDSVSPDFPEVSLPTGFVRGMVQISEIDEHLHEIEEAAWRTPDDHPDLVPVAEAGRLADLLRYLAEGSTAQRKPEGFRRGLLDNAALAADLERMLDEGADGASLSAQFGLVVASCRDCHARYRD